MILVNKKTNQLEQHCLTKMSKWPIVTYSSKNSFI